MGGGGGGSDSAQVMDGFVCFAEAKGNWTADEIGYAARLLVLSDLLFQGKG